MFAELCGGGRPWGHLLELPKPLLIVLFCWPQCVNSRCRMEITYFTRPSDGRESRDIEE